MTILIPPRIVIRTARTTQRWIGARSVAPNPTDPRRKITRSYSRRIGKTLNRCVPGVVEVLGVFGFPVPSNSFSSFHDASFLSAGGLVFFIRLATSAPFPLDTVVVIVVAFSSFSVVIVTRGCHQRRWRETEGSRRTERKEPEEKRDDGRSDGRDVQIVSDVDGNGTWNGERPRD